MQLAEEMGRQDQRAWHGWPKDAWLDWRSAGRLFCVVGDHVDAFPFGRRNETVLEAGHCTLKCGAASGGYCFLVSVSPMPSVQQPFLN